VDLGEKRTGIAISNQEGTFAVPLLVLEHDAEGPSHSQFDALLAEYRVQGIVVGLPLSLSGSPSSQTHHTVQVASAIAVHIEASLEIPGDMSAEYPELAAGDSVLPTSTGQAPLRMVLWDERLSTWEARQLVQPTRGRKRNPRSRPKNLDAHAATIILQSYLDSLNSSTVHLLSEPEDDAGPV